MQIECVWAAFPPCEHICGASHHGVMEESQLSRVKSWLSQRALLFPNRVFAGDEALPQCQLHGFIAWTLDVAFAVADQDLTDVFGLRGKQKVMRPEFHLKAFAICFGVIEAGPQGVFPKLENISEGAIGIRAGDFSQRNHMCFVGFYDEKVYRYVVALIRGNWTSTGFFAFCFLRCKHRCI